MTDEEAIAEFEGKDRIPSFGDKRIGDRTIHYAYSSKEKDTLVAFVHGSPGSWNAFIEFFKADTLLDRLDMVALDRPGFGASDYGRAEGNLQKQAKYLHEVLQSFPHKCKILVGHSLGGPVVVRMGMDYPESYHRLVLVAPSIDPRFEVDADLRKWLRTPIPRLLMPTDFWVSNEEIISARHELEKMIPLWSKICAQVIVIQGSADSLVPKENVDFAREMLPDSLLEIRLLKGVDHFIPWTHPEEVVKALN